jgi:hypothetical protein
LELSTSIEQFSQACQIRQVDVRIDLQVSEPDAIELNYDFWQSAAYLMNLVWHFRHFFASVADDQPMIH